MLAIQVDKCPLLTGHTNRPGGVLVVVAVVGVLDTCIGKAVSDSDIVSTVVTVEHRVAIGTGHRWISAEICYGGKTS